MQFSHLSPDPRPSTSLDEFVSAQILWDLWFRELQISPSPSFQQATACLPHGPEGAGVTTWLVTWAGGASKSCPDRSLGVWA